MSTSMIPISELAGQIQEHYDASQRSATDAVQQALAAGLKLHQLKEQVGHGGWLEFIGDNFTFSQVTASKYMKMAENKALIEEAQIRTTGFNFSIRSALKLIAEEDPAPRQTRQPRFQAITPTEDHTTDAEPIHEPVIVETRPEARPSRKRAERREVGRIEADLYSLTRKGISQIPLTLVKTLADELHEAVAVPIDEPVTVKDLPACGRRGTVTDAARAGCIRIIERAVYQAATRRHPDRQKQELAAIEKDLRRLLKLVGEGNADGQ